MNATSDPSFSYNNSQTIPLSRLAFPLHVTIIVATLAGLLSLCTIGGNLLVLIAFLVERNLRTATNYFLASLAVTDFLIGLISMNLFTIYLILGRWPMGQLFCDLWLSLDYTVCLTSQYTVFFITVDRFCSVRIPAKYRAWRTDSRVTAMIAVTWIVPSTIFFTSILGWPFFTGGRNRSEYECFAEFTTYPVFNTVLTIGYFWVTLVVMCVLYGGIYQVAWRMQKRAEAKRRNKTTTLMAMAAGTTMSRMAMGVGVGLLRNKPSGSPTMTKNNSKLQHVGSIMEAAATTTNNTMTSLVNSNLTSIKSLPASSNFTKTMTESWAENCNNNTHTTSPLFFPRLTDHDQLPNSQPTHTTQTIINRRDPKLPTLTITLTNPNAGPTVNCNSPAHLSETLSEFSTPTQRQIQARLKLNAPPERLVKLKFIDQNDDAEDEECFPSNGIENNSSMTCKTVPNRNRFVSTSSESSNLSESTELLRDILPIVYCNDMEDDKWYYYDDKLSPECVSDCDMMELTPVQNSVTKVSSTTATTSLSLTNNEIPSGFKRGVGGVLQPSNSVRSYRSSTKSVTLPARHNSTTKKSKSVSSRKSNESAKLSSPPNSASSFMKIPLRKFTVMKRTERLSSRKDNLAEKSENRARKALRTISLILGAFVACWTPFHILVLIKGFCDNQVTNESCVNDHLYNIAYWLCYMNSPINPFCYALANAQFKTTFVRLLSGDFHRT